MRIASGTAITLLPLLHLAWSLSHWNIGLVDFYGLAAFSRGLVQNGAWPATPYFPPLYPLLLAPFGIAGNVLLGGYILTAVGLGLSLWALYRLVRLWGGNEATGFAAVILGCLAPVVWVPAGSPSVDCLYTGLAMWFLAAAIACWQAYSSKPAARLPRWAAAGLIVPSLALPLLRYHALILLLPVALVLLILRPRSFKFSVACLLCVLLSAGASQLSYRAAYGTGIASVAGLQVRVGMEIDLRKYYESANALWADYANFTKHSRTTPVTADYTLREIASHTTKSLYQFMRRPPILFALGLVILIAVLRIPLKVGTLLAVLWILLYCVALSPAYYTARAAALPVLMGVAVSLALAPLLLRGKLRPYWLLIATCVLLTGYAGAPRYTRLVMLERLHFAGLSREFDGYRLQHGDSRNEMVVSDWRVMPLGDNPWCEPYASLNTSWIDDPAIFDAQRPGITSLEANEVASGKVEAAVVAISPTHPEPQAAETIQDCGRFELQTTLGEFKIYIPVPASER